MDIRELASVCQLIDQFDPGGSYPTVDRDLQLVQEAIDYAEAESNGL